MFIYFDRQELEEIIMYKILSTGIDPGCVAVGIGFFDKDDKCCLVEKVEIEILDKEDK